MLVARRLRAIAHDGEVGNARVPVWPVRACPGRWLLLILRGDRAAANLKVFKWCGGFVAELERNRPLLFYDPCALHGLGQDSTDALLEAVFVPAPTQPVVPLRTSIQPVPGARRSSGGGGGGGVLSRLFLIYDPVVALLPSLITAKCH